MEKHLDHHPVKAKKPHPHKEKEHEKKKKPHASGTGAAYVGDFTKLIALAIPERSDSAIAAINNEGPEHKQVYSALLLSRAYELIREIEQWKGNRFSIQDGLPVEIEVGEEAIALPVPSSTLQEIARPEKMIDVLGHAPDHEQLAFGILLQAIEWSIGQVRAERKH